MTRNKDRHAGLLVTVERAALLKSLGHVHRVVERRNTIPILSNVLLSAQGGDLRLKATDLDLEVTETLPAMVGEAGATTVPAHVLYDIVRKLPDGSEIALDAGAEPGQMILRAGRSRFVLQTLPDSDFPDLAAGEMPHAFTLRAADLKRLIDKAQFAISTEETRYYLNGIYFHAVDGEGGPVLRAVATDGHRLARVEAPCPAEAAGMPGVIVPRKAVAEIQKLLEGLIAESAKGADGAAAEVGVELSPTKIRITAGAVTLTSKLIDGVFPDYRRVIPAANDKRLVVEREALARAVDRVDTISTKRGAPVKLEVEAEAPGTLTLTTIDAAGGAAREEIEADWGHAPGVLAGFNARYLLDILGGMAGDTVLIRLADPGAPALFLDRDDAPALFVLMPMRV